MIMMRMDLCHFHLQSPAANRLSLSVPSPLLNHNIGHTPPSPPPPPPQHPSNPPLTTYLPLSLGPGGGLRLLRGLVRECDGHRDERGATAALKLALELALKLARLLLRRHRRARRTNAKALRSWSLGADAPSRSWSRSPPGRRSAGRRSAGRLCAIRRLGRRGCL